MATEWECGCRESGGGWYPCQDHERRLEEMIQQDNMPDGKENRHMTIVAKIGRE